MSPLHPPLPLAWTKAAGKAGVWVGKAAVTGFRARGAGQRGADRALHGEGQGAGLGYGSRKRTVFSELFLHPGRTPVHLDPFSEYMVSMQKIKHSNYKRYISILK